MPPYEQAFWNRWHERREKHAHACHKGNAELTRQRFLSELRRYPSQTRSLILELGCGQGHDAIALARCGLDVIALDHSSVAIARARQHARPAGARITWQHRDFADGLEYPDDHFDGIYSHMSLHYLSDTDTRRLFEDIARVLRPGGVLFFTARSVDDALYGQGQQLGDDFYRHQGHVRHFFATNYAEDLLSEWQDVEVVQYVTSDYTIDPDVNPGAFVRALARSPSNAVLTPDQPPRRPVSQASRRTVRRLTDGTGADRDAVHANSRRFVA